jgi:membrane fusion protein, peptide pheromone/bacteriocin exporter
VLEIMDLIPFSLSELSLETYMVSITTRSRIIYWIVVGTIISGISMLPFIYIDVSVQAHGYFQSDIEKQTILAPFQGKVIKTSLKNGDTFKKGDTLLVIDTESIKAQYNSIVEQIEDNNASIKDLEQLTKIRSIEDKSFYKGLITQRYKAEYVNLRGQQSIQLQKFDKKKTEHERNEVLYRQQIIAKSDYENSLFLLNSEKNNLNQIFVLQNASWENDLMLRKNEASKLEADLKACSEGLANRTILAPTDGEIIQCSDFQVGSIVTAGQKIAEISPSGELIANCYVRPADIGLIHEKQKVKIQVDAFNHNEWGMLSGYIINISDDMIIEGGSAAYFRIKCKPDQTFLTLKNGYRAEIKKGMSLSTRIFVVKRSLYHLLFDKADKWFNPYTYQKSLRQ